MPGDEYRRRLVAILSADAMGYTRLMGRDESGTVRALKAHLQTMSELIETHRGRVVDSSGDNLLAEFLSVVDAVRCAVTIQEQLKLRNDPLPEDRRMAFRIGINLGDVILEGDRVYGDSVNVAARVEELAGEGEVFLSGTVYDHVRNKLRMGFEYRGEYAVKNVPEPVRVYRVNPAAPGERAWGARPLTAGRRRVAVLAAISGAVGIAVLAGLIIADRRSPSHVPTVHTAPRGSPAPDGSSSVPGKVATDESGKSPPPKPSTGVPRTSRATVPTVAGMQPPLPGEPSVAVMPFANMSGDPEQDFLCDGFTDDIITTLSKLPRLFVISRSSTNIYKKKPATVQEASRDLGVRYILEGSIQRSGTRLRVNAQLLDGTSGVAVWAERYDMDIVDLFETQDKLLLDIASALAGKLTDGDVAKITRRNTNSLEAWEAIQWGRRFYERYTLEDNLRARDLYRKAAALDPKYVNAVMNIGLTYYIEGRDGKVEARGEAFRQALEIADKVGAMDPSYYGSYFLRAAVYLRQGRHDEAVLYGTKAAEIEPNNTGAVAMLASELTYAGQPEKAIELFHRAMRLSPYYRTWYLDGLGLAYHLAGQHDKAIETFQKSIKRAPNSVWPHLRLATIYAEQGRDAEMHAEAAEVLRIAPKFSIEDWSKIMSFKNPKTHEFHKALMRKAGLPG